LHQPVVSHGLGGALLALAQGIEAVAQLPGGFGLAAELGHDRGCRAFAAGFELADELMHHFPHRKPGVSGRVPVGGQFSRL